MTDFVLTEVSSYVLAHVSDISAHWKQAFSKWKLSKRRPIPTLPPDWLSLWAAILNPSGCDLFDFSRCLCRRLWFPWLGILDRRKLAQPLRFCLQEKLSLCNVYVESRDLLALSTLVWVDYLPLISSSSIGCVLAYFLLKRMEDFHTCVRGARANENNTKCSIVLKLFSCAVFLLVSGMKSSVFCWEYK